MEEFKLSVGNVNNEASNVYFIEDRDAVIKLEFLLDYQLEEIKEKDTISSFLFNSAAQSVAIIIADSTNEKTRKLGHSFFKTIKANKQAKWNIYFKTSNTNGNSAFLEGLLLSSYSFDKYQAKKNDFSLDLNVVEGLNSEIISEIRNIVKSTFIARTLVNEPHSYLNAVQYSHDISVYAKEFGFSHKVWNKAKIIEENMGGILAVNKGSVQEPTFNILDYKGNPKSDNYIVLVGKGITYDTGGLSLKPTAKSMDFMKSDMGGSAAVVGALCAIAAQKLAINVVGLIPATDNRPGLDAIAPGDVITMYSGKTVEVLNTDAEGRLVLADALHYAKQYKPDLVIDLATLTGAAARAIGKEGVVFMGNAEKNIKSQLEESGLATHERLVEFPLWEEYESQIKSDIADIKNLGGASAGAITAGMFLQHFVDYPWIHIDIAGAAYLHAEDSYRGKNGTGVGVRLLYNFLKNWSIEHV